MSDICPKCGKRVYSAEWVVGLGKHYHATCLTCTNCPKRLMTNEIVEHDNKPYCKNCYNKLFGPVGFGAGRSSYADQTEVKKQIDKAGPPVNANSTSAPPAEKPAETKPEEKPAETPAQPPAEEKPAETKAAEPAKEPPKEEKPAETQPAPNPKAAPKKTGDYCPTCGKRVYPAEALSALGRKYHTMCFKCFNCHTTLALGKQFDHNGEPYCQNCSNKLFRIKGYGTGANLTTY